MDHFWSIPLAHDGQSVGELSPGKQPFKGFTFQAQHISSNKHHLPLDLLSYHSSFTKGMYTLHTTGVEHSTKELDQNTRENTEQS